jgi:hypothetical protein
VREFEERDTHMAFVFLRSEQKKLITV